MVWLKFRFLEPISHAYCSIETESQVSPSVRWAIEATLQQKDHRAALSKEQLKALSESEGTAQETSVASEMATRLAYGTVHAPPTGPTATAQGVLFLSSFGPASSTVQQQPQNPVHQMLLYQLHASFNSSRMQINNPPATFGGPPPSTHTTPGTFGPPHIPPIPHTFSNGAAPAPSSFGPAPSSLLANGPGQSTLTSSGNGPPTSLSGQLLLA